MPLITLLNETKLKSLGYGNDRPDGASSNQPYIQTPIPEGREVNSPDFLLRNGYLNFQNSIDDASRLVDYLLDEKSPNGLLFVAKQELLERQNVDVADGINRIYNPLGTVAQAATLSIGTHLNKQGLNYFKEGYYNGGDTGYFKFTNTANNVDEDRLSLLFKAKIADSPDELTAKVGKKIYNITPFSDRVNLISYPGGPGSFLGLGKTNIRIQNETQRVKYISEGGYYQGGTNGYYFATRGIGPYPTYQTLSNGDLENRLTIAYTAKITDKPLGTLSINPFGITNEAGDTVLLTYPDSVRLALGLGLENSSIKILNPTRPTKGIDSENKFQPSFYNVDPTDPLYLTPTEDTPFNPGWTYGRLFNKGASAYYIDDVLNKVLNGSESTRLRLNNNIFSLNDGQKDQNLYLNRNISDNTLNYESKNNTANSQYTYTYDLIQQQQSLGDIKSTNYASVEFIGGEGVQTDGIQDFRKVISDELDPSGINQDLPFSDYTQFNREKTYQDSVTTYKGNWKDGKRVLNPNEWISQDQQEVGVTGEDIIDLNFNIISNVVQNDGEPYNADNNLLIDFRAYLESWNDDIKADWSSVKYMGRAENFYKYNGWSRDASVSFLVPALSRGDMILNYNKLNALAWTVAPDYSSESSGIPGVMRGSIVKFTMGNYFRGMPSIIKGVQFSEIENMGWDINRYFDGTIIEPIDSSGNINPAFTGQLPKGIKVTVNFTPLHNFVPQKGEPFIGSYSGENPGAENVYISQFYQ
jgi:hypothetical protein